ncbi:MAG: hypothetical protein K6B15_08980 [Parasporobacterium sp.]|nr:hypothetical protein [Parasporobacterium sp.]
MKENRFWSIDLTTKNNLTGGFKKRHSEVTKEELQKALKNVTESIRRKAIIRGWKYLLLAVVSNVHLSKGCTRGNWHIHIVLYGTPASVICKTIKAYWTSHGYGNSIQQEIKACWNSGKVSYDMMQGKPRLYQHGITLEDLKAGLSEQWKQELTPEILKNLHLDGKRINSSSFVCFALASLEGWTAKGDTK